MGQSGAPTRLRVALALAGVVLATLFGVLTTLALLLAVPALIYGLVLERRRYTRVGVTLIVLSVVVPIGAVALIHAVLFKAYRSPSPAMAPTLQVGDKFLVHRTSSVGRGDVVVFHPPSGVDTQECGIPSEPQDGHPCGKPTLGQSPNTFVKRVVGLPGDRVTVRNNLVILNGHQLDEPYVNKSTGCDVLCNLPKPITVPPGHLFVMGDNRGESDDSRDWGPVPEGWVIGDVVLRYSPVSRLKFF